MKWIFARRKPGKTNHFSNPFHYIYQYRRWLRFVFSNLFRVITEITLIFLCHLLWSHQFILAIWLSQPDQNPCTCKLLLSTLVENNQKTGRNKIRFIIQCRFRVLGISYWEEKVSRMRTFNKLECQNQEIFRKLLLPSMCTCTSPLHRKHVHSGRRISNHVRYLAGHVAGASRLEPRIKLVRRLLSLLFII